MAKGAPEEGVSAKQAVVPETSKQVPGFEEFKTAVLPLLSQIPLEKVDALLESLYKAAERKVELEGLRAWADLDRSAYQGARLSMKAAMKALSKTLDALKAAKEHHEHELPQIEDTVEGEDFSFRFDAIIQNLEDALEVAAQSPTSVCWPDSSAPPK